MGRGRAWTKVRRLLAIGLRDPREFIDRIAIAAQGRSEGDPSDHGPPTTAVPPASVPASLRELAVHPVIGLSQSAWSSTSSEVDWGALQQEWEGFWSTVDYRAGHDADPALVRTVWTVCRLRRPKLVVESCVGRGLSTAAVLDALERNGAGRLVSLDLPPLADPWFSASAELVPQRLRHLWDYRRGSVRRTLPELLQELARSNQSVSLYIADSLHTAAHIDWEVRTASAALSPGGVIVVDDVQTWAHSYPDVPQRSLLLHDSKGGLFAILRP